MKAKHIFKEPVCPLPVISIVIPAYNEDENIGNCLGAIQALDYPQNYIEIVVVDNGSEDNTVIVAKTYDAKTYSLPNVSIASLRNFGCRKSHGEYLAFLDADCIPCKDWLTIALEKLKQIDNVVAVSGVIAIPESGRGVPWVESLWVEYLGSKFVKGSNFVNTLSSFCFVIRRNTFEDINGFNEKLVTCEDSDFGYRLSKIGKIVVDTDIHVVHLGNAKNLKEFFVRQFWQGRSNFVNFFSHSLNIEELPSVLVPFLFLVAALVAFVMGFYHAVKYSILIWLLFLSIPAVVAVKKSPKKSINHFGKHYIIWFSYLLARGCSLFVFVNGSQVKRSKNKK